MYSYISGLVAYFACDGDEPAQRTCEEEARESGLGLDAKGRAYSQGPAQKACLGAPTHPAAFGLELDPRTEGPSQVRQLRRRARRAEAVGASWYPGPGH